VENKLFNIKKKIVKGFIPHDGKKSNFPIANISKNIKKKEILYGANIAD